MLCVLLFLTALLGRTEVKDRKARDCVWTSARARQDVLNIAPVICSALASGGLISALASERL